MRVDRRLFSAGALAILATGCAAPTKFVRYTGPEVTRITVHKSSRRLYLWHGQNAIKAYDIDLGFAPQGDKKVEGDGRTPEGHYRIDRRNPNSKYHLSLGISYPNRRDVAEAAAMGKRPGGDIFIHGTPTGFLAALPDWTYGCIAVENHEIEEIYAMVRDGTPISIYK